MSFRKAVSSCSMLLFFVAACGDAPSSNDDDQGATGGSASGAAGVAGGGASGSATGGASPQAGSSGAGTQGGVAGTAGTVAGGGGVSGSGASAGMPGGGFGGTSGNGGESGSASGASGAGSGGVAGSSPGGGAGDLPGGNGGRAGAAGSGGAGAGGRGGTGGSAGTDSTLPPGLTSRFPRGDSTGVCRDAALRFTFASNVTLGSSGQIRIYAQSAPGTVVDSINMASGNFTDTVGGKTYNHVRPVFVDGSNQAVAYFHRGRLAANTAYYVTVDAGVFTASGFSGITSTTAWRFTTGANPVASSTLAVAAAGTASLCTVQGALDTVPANNTSAVTINVGAGVYHELIYLTNKRNVTLRGADRSTTTVTYPNNDTLNAGTSGRPMMYLAGGTNGFVLENITIHNTTPQGGSQAEAVRTDGDQVIIRNSTLRSLQDTLLSGGRLYVVNSSIEGNVDYIWGSGVAYFERCEIKTIGRAGYGVQARNTTGYGYVFVDSRLTSDAGITGHVLARIDVTAYPQSHVAFVNCQMGTHIAAAGWTITGGGSTSSLRFWEYQSTTLTGGTLDVSGRAAGSRQINASEAAMMRDKTVVLGGWNPQ